MIKLLKCLLRILLRLLYRVEVHGLAHYRKAGTRTLIVANHSSLLDGILLYAWLPDTPTFAINTTIADKRSFKPYLRFVDLFLMDPTNPLSVKSMIKFLQQDRKAVIFPEGRITITGILMKIYEGPGLIADKADATVLPVCIEGAQHSHASYMRNKGHTQGFPKITIRILAPEKITIPEAIQGHARRTIAANMMEKIMYKLAFVGYDYKVTVFTALLDAAKKYGRKTVIIEDITHQPLNYGQLLTRIFILAQVFRKQTQADEIVGLMLPNVTATVVSYMALQCLGRIPAMLNFSAGIQTLHQACETAAIKTVYSSRKFIANAGLETVVDELSQVTHIVYLEDLGAKISPLDKLMGLLRSQYPYAHYQRLCQNQNTDSPATVLFTSGSEGVPKGAVLSHANLLSNYAQVRCHIDFRPSDTLFSCLPVFHCFGLNAACLMPLLGGAKIFLYPTPLHYRIIPELIYGISASILFGTNTFYRGYAKYAHAYDLSSLRYTVAGAEKLQDDTARLWLDKFGIRILQGYGVTECSPVIAVNTPLNYKAGTVGKLMPDIEAYLEPVEGIKDGGELVVRGPNVMLGYLLPGNEKGQLHQPVASRGHGWYATGDIANIDNDGFITLLGRAKRFAKMGGEMISLTIVEEMAAQTWPGFTHAAVSLVDKRKGEKIILISNHKDAHKKQLRETAKRLRYTELYLPGKIVYAEELPVLSTGKTDYLTLTAMAEKEDQENTGLIGRLTNMVKKHDPPEEEKHKAEEHVEASSTTSKTDAIGDKTEDKAND